MNPSATLREIADLARTPEVKARLIALAAAFEVQHNDQNNQHAITIAQLQLSIRDELAALRYDLNQAIGHVEARQKTMLEMLEELQCALRTGGATEAGG